ncbi:hypothetical protein BDZ89DRAFT_1067432 [Hymenopellis radicata]|nr:hypothetical protein BDZ89DRAFT_1067432 [Hymenopellis radicata]
MKLAPWADIGIRHRHLSGARAPYLCDLTRNRTTRLRLRKSSMLRATHATTLLGPGLIQYYIMFSYNKRHPQIIAPLQNRGGKGNA